jgi:hypothetical protein
MIKCRTCCCEKASEAFYVSNKTECKECVKARVHKHRRDNIERVRAYDRERGKSRDRISRQTIVTREYRHRHPTRYRANNALNNALRDGRITKGECCEACGEPEVEGHHYDYSRPLSVVWLCPACHKAIHLAYPEDHYHNRTGP